MRSKTINKVISKKIEEWLNSIDDEALRYYLRNKIVVTGGAITSLLLNEEVNDFDIYLTTKEAVKRVADYYCKEWNGAHAGELTKVLTPKVAWVLDGEDVASWKRGGMPLSSFSRGYPDLRYEESMEWNYAGGHYGARPSGMLLNTDRDRIKIMLNSDGIAEDSDEVADSVDYSMEEYLDAVSDGDELPASAIEPKEKKAYRPVFLSTNAITLSDKIQIVIRFYGSPEEIHSNYDFVHATNYWESSTGKVVLNNRAMEAIMNKELFYIGSKYPIASMIRTRKFIKRDWSINAGQYLKIAMQISELNLMDIYTLEDQLVGVDSLYFLNFIASIRERIEEGNCIELNTSYVTSVIDKIFD